MAFWDELKEKITQGSQEAIQKTRDMAEVMSTNASITESKRKINELYLELGQMLEEKGLSNTTPRNLSEPHPYRFYVSDDAGRFTDFANSILPVDVKTARIVPIEEY